MVYFLNTNFHPKKKVHTALTKIYGIGDSQALQICDELAISREKRIKQLTPGELERFADFIPQHYILGTEIKRTVSENIQRLVKIGTYRGFRHSEGLPVRGQKTHGNSRTARKLKSSVSFGKK